MGLGESIKQFQVRLDSYHYTLLKNEYEKIIKAKDSLIKYLFEVESPTAFIPFNEFLSSEVSLAPMVPHCITIGKTYISISEDKTYPPLPVPFLLPLSHKGAFLFKGDLGSTCISNLFQLMMLRLSLSIPLELCKFHMVDCDYGRSFANFNSLQNPRIQKTLYGPERVHSLFMEMEDVMRNMYSGEMGKFSNLSEYNRNNPKSTKPYNFIFIDDFPSSCPYQALDQLKAMINNGNAMNAGIYLFINFSSTDNLPRELDIDYFTEQCDVITSKADGVTSIGSLDIFENQKHSNIVETNIPDVFDKIAELLNSKDEVKDDKLQKEFYNIPDNEIWAGNSMSEINIPVGITDKGELAAMHFTQKNALNSALVVGSPGFGKSKFLHSLILNAALRYSPDEVEMYLLDFSGVEFDVYARMNLPHAKIIAPESEREFGVNILEEIYNEGIRRERLCRDNAVDNTEALRKKNNQLIVPRILVIIDEFQELFQRNDKMSSRAYFCINNIIQKYRKFAINLVLSSQKAYQVTSDISIDEIGNRIAFSCHPRDSILVGLDNVSLNLPGGNFIYNEAKGAKNSNINAKTFYIEGDSKENVGDVTKAMNVIRQTAKSHAFKQKDTIVYRSKDLPQFNPSIIISEDLPKEVRLYFGQSFAIRNSDIYVPVIGDSNDNVLIIGGESMISQQICMFTMMSAICTYSNKNKAAFYVFNFLRPDNPLHDGVEACKNLDADITFASKTNDIVENLKNILDEIEKRKEHYSNEMKDIYIFIYAMELGQPFKATKGNYGFEQSEAMQTLSDILRDGSLMHVHTILQIDNHYNLYHTADNILLYFNHRIALQMTSSDSNRLIECDAASNLEVDGEEWTKYRGYYFNQSKNSLTKFRPYNSQI